MLIKKESSVQNSNKKEIFFDITYSNKVELKSIIVFCHGFKGFKDWGHFPMIADYLAAQGYFVLKFNFSHNGCKKGELIDFPDLEAFSENNFSIELDDLTRVLNELPHILKKESITLDPNNINLMGHSRGGGTVIIQTANDTRIKKLITLAAVSTFDRWEQETYDNWKKEQVLLIENGRTKQMMPMKYQIVEDFNNNFERLNIEQQAKVISIPSLIIHGTNDIPVPIIEGELIHSWIQESTLMKIEDANHTFGGQHPYTNNELPKHTIQALEGIIHFLNN